MNFEGAKENIQPLAVGRNVEQLEVALNAESHPEYQEELLQQRRQFEAEISNYVGDDPLELWFEYVTWVEQSYPKSGKESALDDLLKKALSTFEKDSRYTQDPRLIRLFIKYIDTKKNPSVFYTKMYNGGFGTMVADLYIAWAHYYDINDNFDQAKQVYQKGLDARAAPLEHLKQVYERFQFSVGQRIVRKDEYRPEFLASMEEQRNAFTSLRSLKRSKVGSIRTGSAVRSHIPGQVKQHQPASLSSTNTPLNVYQGATQMREPTQPQSHTSVVEDIQNSMVENNIEPGPWSKASSRKSVYHNTNHRNSALKFAILEDSDADQPSIKFGPLPPDDGNLAIKLPDGFVRKNKPQTPFDVPSYVEDTLPPNAIPCYDLFFLHPNKNVSFTIEELRQYRRCKRLDIANEFTKRQDKFWLTDSSVPTRIPPRFVRTNQPDQVDMVTERPDISSIPSTEHFVCKIAELYPADSETEFSFEELMRQNRPISQCNNDGMDETICVRGRQSFGVKHVRKSICMGGRKSIMPLANDRGSVTLNLPTVVDDTSSDMELDDDQHGHKLGDGISEQRNCKPELAVGKMDKLQEKPVASAENGGQLKKSTGSLPTAQWSIFNDEASPPVPSTNNIEQKSVEKKQSPLVVGWSIFKDDDVLSPTLFSSKTVDAAVESSEKTKEIFAVPHPPLTGSLAEKRTLESAMKNTDNEAPDVKRTFLDTQQSKYPIGPDTGVVKKSIRKSTITENALQANPTSRNEIEFKSPADTKSHETTYMDYSLCTQKFNINLAEQMASTPVSIRRLEALTEQTRAQDTQPLQPLKLSTIMETTEGSAHTASTKSSTQFSSPEDNDVSKRTMNCTKFVGTTSSPDSDASEEHQNVSRPVESVEIPFSSFVNPNGAASSSNYSCAVEKTLPKIQMSLMFDGATTTQVNSDVTTATKDVPTKHFPFPIFEDTQTTATIAQTITSQPSPKGNELLEKFSSESSGPSEATIPLPVPALHTTASLEPSTDLQNSNHANDSRFQMQSLWVKDEPQSFSLNASVTDESFAMPNVRQPELLAQPSRPTDRETSAYSNDVESATISQDDSATVDESFAIPSAPPTKSSLQQPNSGNVGDGTFALDETSYSDEEEEEVIVVPDETFVSDDTMTETIPKIVQVQSLAQPINYDGETRISISLTEDEMAAHMKAQQGLHSRPNDVTLSEAANCDQSIYFKHNSILVEPSWLENETEPPLPEAANIFQHEKVNLEESRIFIETKLAEPAINPFSEQLKMAILQELAFIHLLEDSETSHLVRIVPPVTVKRTIPFKDMHFDVLKCIGHGAYGRVYSVKSTDNGAMYAVKKEMPANLWEYYILCEVHRRIAENVLCGFMKIEMAIIGNNGSLLFSQYSPYGTLLDVCNGVFTSLHNNVNETIVFILAYQMLELIDHLHRADILHLDLKPDNFLVMKKMSANPADLVIQLIDFGNAVDLKQFPPGQQFNAALETKHFICIEMVEQRHWIFQPDLYCLAGTVHSVLFGKYMEVYKNGTEYDIQLKIPRYCNRPVWGRFFRELINVKGDARPDLQDMKKSFHDAITSDKKLEEKIKEFNRFIVERPK